VNKTVHSRSYARTASPKNVHANHKNKYEMSALTSSTPHDHGYIAGKNATTIDASIHPNTKLHPPAKKHFSVMMIASPISTQLYFVVNR
jgi:hypothetical protein